MGTKYTVIKIRRNNDYNYEKVKDTFIPKHGELCLVDTLKSGLRVKCGDGISTYGQLDYIDTVIYQGFLIDGEFYQTSQGVGMYEHNTNKIYVDLAKAKFYIYNNGYQEISGDDVPSATEVTAGIMKLYNEQGDNIDGTMTQKSITEGLKEKVTAKVEGELVTFS